MAADEPPYLNVGTDVSAKYKGAFCEAKIKKVNRVVKCKVTFKNNMGSAMVPDEQIRGALRIGADVEAKHPEKNQFYEAIINKLQDYSQYTVVFDDGDETTLRRTSLCLKSGRHFAESPTLDQFPLTNPEHFGTPVIGTGKSKRKRRSTMNSASLDYDSSDEDLMPRNIKVKGKEKDSDVGKVVCVDYGDRRKKDNWYPGIVVPHKAQSNIRTLKEEYLIRSFKDGKYYQVPKRDTREFIRESLQKVDNNTLRSAVDKALLYYEKGELPHQWDKSMFGAMELPSADEESDESDSEGMSSDDEPSEEKDRFVAQLYKFMDERGTPINRAPTVGNRDVNLYKLFKIIHKMGGHNKVANQNKWKVVYMKMGLPSQFSPGLHQLKCAYKRFLHSFEDFYRTLGCTMVTNTRSTRGRHRADRNIIVTRNKDRDAASPKGRNSKDSKDRGLTEKKNDDKSKVNEKKEVRSEEISSKCEDKPRIPDKKTDRTRSEEKDDRVKRDEKPRLFRSQSLIKDKKEASLKDDEKYDIKPEKARTREDARKEKNESPEKKGTRSSLKIELERKEREETLKSRKDKIMKGKDKKEERQLKDIKDEKQKDRKDDKNIKEKVLLKDKNVDEKIIKDKEQKFERLKKDKANKEERQIKEKRDSSRETKDEKIFKGKRDDLKNQTEKSPPKKKQDTFPKEKREEKLVRSRRDNQSPSSDLGKKSSEDSDSKCAREEKQLKDDMEIKKEDQSFKEKTRTKPLKEIKEGSLDSEDGNDILDVEAIDDKDGSSQDGFEKIDPSSKTRCKRPSLKSDDKDEKEHVFCSCDSDDQSFTQEERSYSKDMKQNEIEIGDRVRVKYGKGRTLKVYEAKVLKIEVDGTDKKYYVHYAGWNMRYDEWVCRSYIVANVSGVKKQKQDCGSKNSLSSMGLKKTDRGRPPGAFLNTKPMRKNSTSSTNSSVSCPRTTRSDKKSLHQSPFSSTLEPKKSARKKSGMSTGLTDTSQESDSDGEDMDLDDEDMDNADVEDITLGNREGSFKEELFSDDEEKEKLEDVKRDDITELEKAISIEESTDNLEDLFLSRVIESNDAEEKPIEKLEHSDCNPNNLKSDDNKIVETVEQEHPELLKVTENDVQIDIVCDNFKVQYGKLVPEKKLELDEDINTSKTVGSDNCLESKPVCVTTSPIPVANAKILSFTTLTEIAKDIPATSSTISESVSNDDNLSVAPTISRSTLNWHGLIHEKSSDTSVNGNVKVNIPDKIISEDNVSKSNDTCHRPYIPDVKDSKKGSANLESVSVITDTKSEGKMQSVFTNVASCSTQCNTDLKYEEKPSKDIANTLTSVVIPKNTKEIPITTKPKLSDVEKPLLTHDHPEEKQEQVTNNTLSQIKENLDDDKKMTENVHSTLKQSNNEYAQENNIQNTNLPIETTSDIHEECAASSDIKDNFQLFSLKEKNTSEIICKPSETVDLSKTIPGILERLKKDVVADLKFTDSPPPRKELNFDFLRGSEENAKCLSRSDSSNSLQICEDMSDTNDSINDHKDATTQEKLDSPQIIYASLSSDILNVEKGNAAKISNELNSLLKQSRESLVDTSISMVEGKKMCPHTSVITILPSTSLSTLPTVSITESNTVTDSCITLSDLRSVSPSIDFPLKKEISATSNNSLIPHELEGNADNVPESKDVLNDHDISNRFESKKNAFENDESRTQVSLENKDSLFDDLLKIKYASCSYNQSNASKQTVDSDVIVSNISREGFSADENDKIIISDKQEELVSVHVTNDSTKACTENTNKFSRITVLDEKEAFDKIKNECPDSVLSESQICCDDNVAPEEDGIVATFSKKENKKKKSKMSKLEKHRGSLDGFDKDDSKDIRLKDGKSKSKKRAKLESSDLEKGKDSDIRSRSSKKIKKSKSKKRLSKHDDQFGDYLKKMESKDEENLILEKVKKKEKRKNDKRILKSSVKSDDANDPKGDLVKKKKGKKSRYKLNPKMTDKKKKKDRKKFKVKDCSSSDDATDNKFFKPNKDLHQLFTSSEVIQKQDSKNDDPDMSFLLCKEKVPASPVGINSLLDEASGSSSMEESCSPREKSPDDMNKHKIDTPPTTPSSTESLLSSSSPSHERDAFPLTYPESTQSGEGESDVFHCTSNRTVMRKSEEYSAATTLAFGVCQNPTEKQKDSPHNFKRKKSETEDHSKRKKKSKRMRRSSESAKSPRHKSSFPRMSKVESFCEDSSCASLTTSSSPPYGNTSTLIFSKPSPHRLISVPEATSRYNFYIPLHDKDPEKRIAVLQEKMAQLRKEYLDLKEEVATIDRRRKKARKKIRDTAGSVATNPSVQSEDGHSCS